MNTHQITFDEVEIALDVEINLASSFKANSTSKKLTYNPSTRIYVLYVIVDKNKITNEFDQLEAAVKAYNNIEA